MPCVHPPLYATLILFDPFACVVGRTFATPMQSSKHVVQPGAPGSVSKAWPTSPAFPPAADTPLVFISQKALMDVESV